MSMTSRAVMLGMLVALFPALLSAQDRNVEVGLGLASAQLSFSEGDSAQSLGLPGATALGGGLPSLYACLPFGPNVALEPQATLVVWSADDEVFHFASLAAQLDYFLRPPSERSAYFFGRGIILDMDQSDSYFGAGGGVGYRIPVGDRAVVRLEGRFDHFFERDYVPASNVVSLGVTIGMTL